jgi:hypothetical protein
MKNENEDIGKTKQKIKPLKRTKETKETLERFVCFEEDVVMVKAGTKIKSKNEK